MEGERAAGLGCMRSDCALRVLSRFRGMGYDCHTVLGEIGKWDLFVC